MGEWTGINFLGDGDGMTGRVVADFSYYQNKACCESFLVVISKLWEFTLCDKSLASFGDEKHMYRLNGSNSKNSSLQHGYLFNGVGNSIRVRVSGGFFCCERSYPKQLHY